MKQNLNKSYGELNRELTLRPNNNDLSVMSIIQGRRMTLSSTKPGLVVVGLEEVPPAKTEEEGEEGDEAIEQVRAWKGAPKTKSHMKGADMQHKNPTDVERDTPACPPS